jgi:hypothetical protein
LKRQVVGDIIQAVAASHSIPMFSRMRTVASLWSDGEVERRLSAGERARAVLEHIPIMTTLVTRYAVRRLLRLLRPAKQNHGD